MRVLVLGSGGQVGRAVIQSAPKDCEVRAVTHAELDIADERAVVSTLQLEPVDWIINAAAYTAVDRAEREREQVTAVNDTAVGNLARAAAGAQATLLHLSTDFVFDGRANRAYAPLHEVNPVNAYGVSKLAGENHIWRSGGRGMVLRTAWVYASSGRNFVLTMLHLMRGVEPVRVVCDQIGSPTWATGLARAIWGMVTRVAPNGIYHWSDLGVASWYDFAVAIQEEALLRGLLRKVVPIVPIESSQFPTPAVRPAFSVLNSESTRTFLGITAHHWRQNLRTMLDELRTA